MPDNYSQFLKYDHEHSGKGRPVCACCDNPVWEEYFYRINGEIWCPDCVEETREYVEE